MTPANLVNFGGAVNFPLVLSLIIVVFALATLVHVLVVSSVRRSRDTGILSSIGFNRRQNALTVIWQTTSITAIAAVIGVPLGIALGRWVWRFFAGNLGVVPIPMVPVGAIVSVLVGTIVGGLLVAVWPAYLASHRSTGCYCVSSNGLASLNREVVADRLCDPSPARGRVARRKGVRKLLVEHRLGRRFPCNLLSCLTSGCRREARDSLRAECGQPSQRFNIPHVDQWGQYWIAPADDSGRFGIFGHHHSSSSWDLLKGDLYSGSSEWPRSGLQHQTATHFALLHQCVIPQMERPDTDSMVKLRADVGPTKIHGSDVAGTDHPLGVAATIGQELPHLVRRDGQLLYGDS